MEAMAKTKYLKIAPRKLKQIVDLVRGKNVHEAIDMLHFMPKKGAKLVEKTLRSAVANLVHNEGGRKVDEDAIIVKKAFVDQGPTAKRFKAGPMGRGLRILKRSSHVTLIVGEAE